ncbi:MAG: ornithine cyclodeaminase family protein [Pseudomonadota bacterium]|nr:ornithine cyclodeaminase family protein [Pseudomonadota bacterium]
MDAATVDRVLDETELADRIGAMFRDGCEQPVRHHHTVAVPGEPDATLLLMPAWQPGAALGVKLASVFPGAGSRGLPAVQASYLLLDARTGAPRVLIDGARLTVRRTAAASGLAARYLARPDAETLLMVGAGALAPCLIRAHRAARPSLRRLLVWNHNPGKAEALAAEFGGTATRDLDTALGAADVISCATLSREPLVQGDRLRPGSHVDLVGAFTPAMRESDDAAIRRASVFVDTRAGALKEGGDLVQAVASGALQPEAVAAELADLTRGTHPGRRTADEITLFKSVGAALEDLAAALLVAERAGV